MSTGLPTLAAAGRNERSRAAVSADERWEHQAPRLARVRRQDPGSAGVGQDADAAAARHGLVREQHRHVEELLERAGPDDAGLPEERVDDRVRLGERAGVGRRGARSRRATART